jgi:hypothetical protein
MMGTNYQKGYSGGNSGGVRVTPEEYQEAERKRRAMAFLEATREPVSLSAAGEKEMDEAMKLLHPWKIWRRNDSSKVEILTPIMTIREYVEAHTRSESWGRKDLEKPLAGAYWPKTRGKFSWINAMLFCSLMALLGYALGLSLR